MMKITVEQLEKLGACKEQVLRFQELFGDSVEVTHKLCLEHALNFSWDWIATKLATTEEWAKSQIRSNAGQPANREPK